MARAIKALTFAYMIFLALRIAEASASGIVSTILYCAAHFVPLIIGLGYSSELKKEREEITGLAEGYNDFLLLKKNQAVDLIAVAVPSVAVVFFLALVTSFLLNALGFSNTQTIDMKLWQMLLVHAVLPALCEELIFRYLPMKLLLPYSPRYCVIVSSLCFALMHLNFFQMPYAFAAGVIFMSLNVALKSIWPSVILHFLNNLLSILCMKYCLTAESIAIFAVILLAVALISLIFVLRRFKIYKSYAEIAFDKGQRLIIDNTFGFFVILSLGIAFVNLLK